MLLDFDRLGALRWALLSIGAAVALFLLLPIVFIVALSFGDSQWLIFPPPGWTLESSPIRMAVTSASPGEGPPKPPGC